MQDKTELLAILAGLLFATGIFFRDNGPVYAGFALFLMLLADYYILGRNTQNIVNNFICRRTTDKRIIIIGKNTDIITEFDVKIPHGNKVIVQDIIPEGSVVDKGSSNSLFLITSGKYSLKYSLLCMAHGINRFGGVRISVSDNYFSKHIILHGKNMNDTEVVVFPKPSFIKNGFNHLSVKNTDKMTTFKSQEVKGLREYTVFDDVRTIDWKATAKYDKLHVRDYFNLEQEIQSIIIDLPDSEDPEAKKKNGIIRGLAGAILMNREIVNNLNIIFISGPNLKEVVESTKSDEDRINIIEKIIPAFREKHLYRYSPTLYENNNRQDGFEHVLSNLAGDFFHTRTTHIFEKQINGIIRDYLKGDELILITHPEQEISHLRIINKIAELKKIKTICLIPNTGDSVSKRSFIVSSGFNEVNIL